jgi:hypothetical protein
MSLLRERLVYPDLPEFIVEGCLWGEGYGSRPAEKSIFRYADTGGSEYTAEDEKSDMWRLLAADPMAGLRLLALNRGPYQGRAPGQKWTPGEQLENEIDGLLLPEKQERLIDLLRDSQIEGVFSDVCTWIKSAPAFVNLTNVASPPMDPYRDAIAEALVALSIQAVAERGKPAPYICFDDDCRQRTTAVIREELGPVSAALPGLGLAKTIGRAALRAVVHAGNFAAVTPYLHRHRGSLVETATPHCR